MAKNKNFYAVEKAWWISLTGIGTIAIGFGVVEYVKQQGWNPLYLVVGGFAVLSLVVYLNKVTTTTSMGSRK